MEAFLKGGRKRKSESSIKELGHDVDEESTDVKLAILASLLPGFGQEVLLEALLAHDGSVEKASASLIDKTSAEGTKQRQASRVIGSQTSLKFFASTSSDGGASPGSKKAKLMSKKGTTLHLYDPQDVAAHTPCTIIHNFLPPEVANALLREMLEESKSFEKITFKLFENVVHSPHTSSFYVETEDELSRQRNDYYYNGDRLTDVRKITPKLLEVKPLVQEGVNQEIAKRIKDHYPNGQKLRFQSPETWSPNAAFVNCYNGPQENVGYHSDQLTYLGPRAVIGSLSLGVARSFRVRRMVPKDTAAAAAENPSSEGAATDDNNNNNNNNNPDAEGQISIHLPHNSLLVMHAEMQEEWKHSIAPALAIDPHPIAGNRRINVTYRDYKAAFHPRLTPRCKCGIPCVLKVVQRRRENWGRYFWMCHGGYVPGKESCSFFAWAEFDDDGNPSWDRERYGKGLVVVGAKNDPSDSKGASVLEDGVKGGTTGKS